MATPGMTQPAVETTRPPQFAWARRIALPFLDHLGARLGLTERNDPQRPRHRISDPGTGEQAGTVQVFDGTGLQAAVLTSADTDLVRIWQLVAFTPPESPLPHLSFEASANPGGCWLSLDLIPRVAPTEHPDWTAAVYEPLSDLVWQLHTRGDARQALIRARHRMRLSPWLLTLQLEGEDAVDAAAHAVSVYADRFCDLVEQGLPPGTEPSLSPAELAARDAREREQLYSWDATNNYRFLEIIGGEGTAEIVQHILREP